MSDDEIENLKYHKLKKVTPFINKISVVAILFYLGFLIIECTMIVILYYTTIYLNSSSISYRHRWKG